MLKGKYIICWTLWVAAVIFCITCPGPTYVSEPVAAVGSDRSPEWSQVRAAHLVKEPACAACGSVVDLNVHHIEPFHLHPEKELLDSNLITLCNAHHCHLMFGHLGYYQSYNVDVREDAAHMRDKIKNRP